MEKVLLLMAGLSCLGGSGFVLFKLAPREGEPGYAWLESDGTATAVTLAIVTVGALGLGLLISVVTG